MFGSREAKFTVSVCSGMGQAQVIRHVALQLEVEQVTPHEARGRNLSEPVRRRPFN